MKPSKVFEILGLRCVVEKAVTSGHEFIVEDKSGQTVAYGWIEGTKTEALNEAVKHPAIQLRMRSAGLL